MVNRNKSALSALVFAVVALALSVTACGAPVEAPTAPDATPSSTPSSHGLFDTNGDGLITVGLAKMFNGGSWSDAYEQSVKDYFVEANGFKLLFEDAFGSEEKHLALGDGFITQGAEVIVIDGAMDDLSRWKPVVMKARDAGVRVIFANSYGISVDPANNDDEFEDLEGYYEFAFRNSMFQEGQTAAKWLQDHIASNNMTDPVKIVHLQIQCTRDRGRTEAMEAAVKANGWEIVYSDACIDRENARRVMGGFLEQGKGEDFNVIYCERAEFAFGVIDALEDAGIDPERYVIITFDAGELAVEMVAAGKIDVVVESTPFLGPQLGELIRKSSAGETLPKFISPDVGYIDASNAAEVVCREGICTASKKEFGDWT